MKSNLAQIFRIQRYLNDIKYPDAYRIAREISNFLKIKKSVSETDVFNRLHKQEPWEYVRGSAEFCKSSFKVNKDILIPRIETEQLVYESKRLIEKAKIKNIIDVGTGSGCIIISLAKLLDNPSSYSFYATDISSDALKIAKLNEKNILNKKFIKWFKTNLIEKLPTLSGNTIIVANLPYIPSKQYENLDRSVKQYEPRIALDGGDSGLEYYSTLFKQIIHKKVKVKYIYLETEESNFKQSKKIIKNYFPNSKVVGIKDCFDRKRFVKVSF
ncbi:peptide chain release factor N(5)-glutamine methyltransferase [Candidatus Dojkabacteria bacterium]|nr:peptide chain release factor N(5)-glutamine methyltransferase [Candidatus Dojkabacteria bacterium]